MEDDDLIPANPLPCPYCGFWVMIPWDWWMECPRCAGETLPA